MCKRLLFAISFLFSLIFPFLLLAQPADLRFTSVSVRNGLSSNIINDIQKDRYGYMWFATEDGLNRFDGKDFTVYRHKKGDSTSLGSNEITCLFEDNKGILWIGTSGGSLARYIREKDCFYTYKPHVGKHGLNSSIKSITGDHFGNIWIATYGGLNILNPKTNSLYKFPIEEGNTNSLPSRTALFVFEDSKKRMWVGTDKGLLLYNRQRKSFRRFLHSESKPNSLISDRIRTIAEDKKGNIWIGTDKGICKLVSIEQSLFKNYSTIIPLNTDVYTIKADGDDFWVGTEDGLIILNTITEKSVHIKSNQRQKYGLSRNSIRSIFIDKTGIYWIGTFQGGVNKFDKNLTLFNAKQSIPFDPFSLRESLVTSFAEKDENTLFVGTDKGGVYIFNRQTELFHPVDLKSKLNKHGNLSVLCLKKSKSDQLWIGTYRDGLFVRDLKNGDTKQFLKGKVNDGSTINSNDVFCMTEDRKGNIWIGTNGDGINIYNFKTEKFDVLNKSSKPNPLPLNGYIRAIVEDHSGDIWIGSHGTGLAKFNPIKNTFEVFNRGNSNIPDNTITTLYIDSKNRLWVGTMGSGVSLLKPSDNSFINFSEKDGLLNSDICAISEDKNGYIWISSNKGLSSVHPVTRKIKNYTIYNGVINNNFVKNASLRTKDGTLFFGNLEGFNFFNTSNLKVNKNIPPVLLTELKVDNKSITPQNSSIIKRHISVAGEVILNYSQNFSFSYTGLNYTAPQQNQYVYKLDGYDKDWNFVGTSKVASYTNIAPGEYIFRVKASNNDGLWNNKGTAIKVIVKPPFWLTIYAYIVYIVAVLSLLYYLRWRGIKKIEARFKKEQEILKAKQLFEQEKREVERQYELDKMKLKFLTNLSHEFRTPISLIMAPVDKILHEGVPSGINDQISAIKRNTRRLLNMVNQLLDFRKLETQELKLDLQKGELVGFIKDLVESFKDLSDRKKINLRYYSNLDSFQTYFDADKIERILFNLLSNAFKFTNEGGEVVVELEQKDTTSVKGEEQWLIIRVKDTGIGIPPEFHENIFSRFFQNEVNTSILNQGNGIGLSITKEFVEMHGGRISVESEVGKGAAFNLEIPFLALELDTKETEIKPETEFVSDKVADIDEKSVLDSNEFTKILIVEDNEEYRYYLKDTLGKNYRVLEAANGKEGWQQALYHHTVIIISDINMHEMDGIELTNKIKSDKRTSHIAVILLTARSGEEEQLDGLKKGADDYITKPVNFEILNIKVRNILKLNKKLKETYSRQIKVESPAVQIESENEKLLNKIILYIEENLTDPKLSVEDLSKHIGMSRVTFYHKMLDITGATPIEFIRNIKLQKALVLLEKSDMNVAQISYCVGFATPNYFAKSFKAKFGMLPSEYINLKRGNE